LEAGLTSSRDRGIEGSRTLPAWRLEHPAAAAISISASPMSVSLAMPLLWAQLSLRQRTVVGTRQTRYRARLFDGSMTSQVVWSTYTSAWPRPDSPRFARLNESYGGRYAVICPAILINPTHSVLSDEPCSTTRAPRPTSPTRLTGLASVEVRHWPCGCLVGWTGFRRSYLLRASSLRPLPHCGRQTIRAHAWLPDRPRRPDPSSSGVPVREVSVVR
jgi:hypothetical protein